MNYLYDISNWLDTNTFQLKEFSNLKELETLKNKKGHTVSVVIPTLEEETTIEYVLRYLIDKLILENKITESSNLRISLNNFISGIYFIEIISKASKETIKFIKK